MPILTQELREVLPKLGQQAESGEYLIYAHFLDAFSDTHWYVAEGQQEGEDFRFFGFVKADGKAEWNTFLLSALERYGRIESEGGFDANPFSDVIPAPED